MAKKLKYSISLTVKEIELLEKLADKKHGKGITHMLSVELRKKFRGLPETSCVECPGIEGKERLYFDAPEIVHDNLLRLSENCELDLGLIIKKIIVIPLLLEAAGA